jgi:hypothetical protein
MPGMAYEHTQPGRFHWLLYAVAVLTVVGGWTVRSEGWAAYLLWGVGGLIAILAMSFHYLTVREDGEHLAPRFGPVPLLGKRIPYAQIRGVRAARSKLFDGWGIHWVPGRGWTFNLWGFDCVEVDMQNGKTLRIGTDDVDGLVGHLVARAPARA